MGIQKIQNQLKLTKDSFEYLNKLLKAPNFIINLYNEKIHEIIKNLNSTINNKLSIFNLNLSKISSSLTSPDSNIKIKKISIIEISKNIENIIHNKYQENINNLKSQIRLLNSNSISSNLNKGYSIIIKKGKIVKNKSDIKNNDKIKVKLKDASIDIKIRKIN